MVLNCCKGAPDYGKPKCHYEYDTVYDTVYHTEYSKVTPPPLTPVNPIHIHYIVPITPSIYKFPLAGWVFVCIQ